MTLRTATKNQSEVETVTKINVNHRIKPPNMFNVIYYNNEKTPYSFVYETLIFIFKNTPENAQRLTDELHETGSAIVATLPFEIAELKVHEVKQFALTVQVPLDVRLLITT